MRLCNVVLNALAAQGILFLFPEFLHTPGVFFNIYRKRQTKNLYAAGRDAQPSGEITDNAFALFRILQKEIHRQHFKYPDQPAIPGFENTEVDIYDGQATLQVVIRGREALRCTGLFAEDEFFYVQF